MALQALYQWLMAEQALADIELQYSEANEIAKVDAAYFSRILHGVVENLTVIEQQFEPFLDRPKQSLGPIELTILRLCTYELLFVPEIPYRVILDESVSLARAFGAQEGHRYVNGVLNNVARRVRIIEIEGEQ